MFRYNFLISLLLFASSSLLAQSPGEKPAQVALLGTFHFAGSSDLMSLKAEDLQTPRRAAEIEELVQALQAFKPTKILLEAPKGDTRLDSLYQAYLSDEYSLGINEREQIGFRLAKKMEHVEVFAVDHYVDLPFGELMSFLQSSGQMEHFQSLLGKMQEEVMAPQQEFYEEHDLRSFFAYMNSKEFDALNRNSYLQHISKYVSNENDIGIRVVSTWWDRNFRIMSNIDAVTEPGDRLLVLFGQGHTSLLKNFYRDRTDVEYVEISRFLRGEV